MIVLDTDVLLDVALNREPHVAASAGLIDLLEQKGRLGFVAWHSISNFYYLVRPSRGADRARAFVEDLTSFVRVAPIDTKALRFAASLPIRDLEDGMVVAAARACGALYIATRNVRDFKKSPVPARTPAQLLAEWA